MNQKYDKEFKMQTVQMILEQGKSVAQTARELGIFDKTLYYWVKSYKEDQQEAFRGKGREKEKDRELRQLQKQIRDLQEENAILKKAPRIFANDPK